MGQANKLLAAIPPKQRWTIVIVALIVGSGLFAFARYQKEAGFRPLFQALAPEDAAGIVQKLREGGVEYRISENGSTVSVPAERVAELRLEMAGQGLPKSGRIGFELFDKTNFGATDFTEHVNYGRALEGELERSIISMNAVEQARVHITFAKDSVFLESRQPAKASVLLRLRAGSRIDAQSVVSITHLVSSAVEGLAPEAVSVLDMRGNLLNRPRRVSVADGAEPPDASLDFQQQLERSLVTKISATLEPLLGADKFRAAASADIDFTSGDQSEEIFDPSKSVMVSSQKIEDTNGAPSTAGVPGTASNLPRPESAPAKTKLASSRQSESVTYQTSRTVKHTRIPQGNVKRLSVSVLVDQGVRWEKQQQILVPPAPEKMKMIHDIVAGVIGFNATRGDQLIVETLPFESTLNAEPPSGAPTPKAPVSGPVSPLDKLGLPRNVLYGIAGGVVLLLITVVFLVSRRKSPAPPAAASPALPLTGEPTALPPGATPEQVAQLAQRQLGSGKPDVNTLVTQVRDATRKDADTYAEVLQTWLTEEKAH